MKRREFIQASAAVGLGARMVTAGNQTELPPSAAVIGVASVDQLKANISSVKEARPMTLAGRQELERTRA